MSQEDDDRVQIFLRHGIDEGRSHLVGWDRQWGEE